MEENNDNGFQINPNVNQTNGQPVKNKKKSKLVSILVTIILVLILALGLCIYNMYAMSKGYDNLFIMIGTMLSGKDEVSGEKVNKEDDAVTGKDEKNDLDNSEEVKKEEKITKEDENKDYIYERESYTVKFEKYDFESEIKIPYININSEDAISINQEIYEMYEEAVKTVEQEYDEYSSQSYTQINYEASILENMLSICVIKTHIVVPGGGFRDERIVYNINLEDGRKLSLQEVLEKFDLEVEDLNNKIQQKLKEEYKNIDKDIKEMYATENAYVEAFEYDIFNTYFKSDRTAIVGINAGHLYGSGYLEIDLVDATINKD